MTEAQQKEGRGTLQSFNSTSFILSACRGNINRRKMTTGCFTSNDIKQFESDIDGELGETTINSSILPFPLPSIWRKLSPRHGRANSSPLSVVLECHLTCTRKTQSELIFLLYWRSSIKIQVFQGFILHMTSSKLSLLERFSVFQGQLKHCLH